MEEEEKKKRKKDPLSQFSLNHEHLIFLDTIKKNKQTNPTKANQKPQKLQNKKTKTLFPPSSRMEIKVN